VPKTVVVYPEPGQEGKFFDKMPNDWHIMHHQLRDELTALDFEVHLWPEYTPNSHDVGLCFDFPYPPRVCTYPDKSLLVILEPPIIHPRQYEKMNGLPFTRICCGARDFCDEKRVFWEPFPVVKCNVDVSGIPRDKEICAVSGGGKNFPPVTINGREYMAYYHARKMVYVGLGKDLDLYGFGWESDYELINSVNYKGPIQGHKVPVMAQYKHAIVFENCYCEGWASEKQYDAYQAGVIPIIRGWRPDYPWEYAQSDQWAKRIASHVKAIT